MELSIAWSDLARALGLVLVIEGLLPFLWPAGLKQAMQKIVQVDDRVLRTFGLVAMIAGILVLQTL